MNSSPAHAPWKWSGRLKGYGNRGTPAPARARNTRRFRQSGTEISRSTPARVLSDAFPTISHHRRARSHSGVRVGRTCCRRGLPCGREHALPSDQRERRQGQSQSGHDGQMRRCAPFGCVLRQASEVISEPISCLDLADIKGKGVYCRCWRSKTFPNCDASHVKWNEERGDNVGPLIVMAAKPAE